MNFSRYKADHLASFLRNGIAEGEWNDPLPSIRNWSDSLMVSSVTLQSALKILKKEGVLASIPRKGHFLLHKPVKIDSHTPIVRWMFFDPKHRYLPPAAENLSELSQKLADHHIGFHLESCNEGRILAYHREGSKAHELLAFLNMSRRHQELFSGFSNALMIGEPFAGINLPYISCDVFSAIRHATFRLSRHGFRRIILVNAVGRANPEDHQRIESEFNKFRLQAPRPVEGGVLWLHDDLSQQCCALQKFANTVRSPCGLIVNAPVSPGLIMMVLGSCGLKIPEQINLLPINCSAAQLIVFPQLTSYRHPIDEFTKTVCLTAIQYFKAGQLPALKKNIELKICEL